LARYRRPHTSKDEASQKYPHHQHAFRPILLLVLLLTMGGAAAVHAQTPVSGTLPTDTHWTLAGSPYQVTGHVTVPQGTTLTIDAGVRVEFNRYTKLDIYGTLSAVGTSVQPIRFTGATEGSPGWWAGIYVTGTGSADLQHCTVAYAGYSYKYAALHKTGSGPLTLAHSTVNHSFGSGLYLEGNTGTFTSSDNTFSNNAQGVRVGVDTSFIHDDTSTFAGNTFDAYLNGGTMSGEVSWYLDSAYSMYLSGHLTVADGALLQVLPGTVVKVAQYMILTVEGTLAAVGEAGNPIAFTDPRDDALGGDANGDGNETLPAPNWWAGIYVTGTGSADLQHCTVAYAGYSYQYAGLHKTGSGPLTLAHSTMDHSYGAGLYLDGNTGTVTSSDNIFSNNARGVQVAVDTSFVHDDTSTFAGNSADVHLNGGTMSGEVSWYLDSAYSMYLSDHLTVADGATLNVLPGTVVKAAIYSKLTVDGTLAAVGEAAKPIAFTHWRDDALGGDANGDGNETLPAPNWWAGIYVTGTGSADLQHCTVAYAGYSYQHAALHKTGSGPLTLAHSTMDHSFGSGLYLDGNTGAFTSSNNIFSNNARGVQVAVDTSFLHDDTTTFAGNSADVHLNGGTMSGEVSWYLDSAYSMYLSDHLTVADGATLNVLPGTVVKAAIYSKLTVEGSLAAVGEAAKPIAFTDWRDDALGGDANGDGNDTLPAPGWWAGIYVAGTGSADLQHCTVAYAGYSYQYAGLHKSGSGALTLKNSTVDHSSSAGLYLLTLEGKWLRDGVDGDGDGYLYGLPPSDARTSYFIAPDDYHGDWRNYEELRLTLWSMDGEYYIDDTHASWRGDVYLANGDMFAYTVLPRRPAQNWDQFSISLTDSAVQWVFGGGAGSLADVLANVTAFHVRGKYGRGVSYTGLDRVALFETPQGAPVMASPFPGNDTHGWTSDIGTMINPAGIDRDGSLTSSGNMFSNNAHGIRVAIDTSFVHDDTSTFTGNGQDVYLNGGTMTGEVSWYLNPAFSMYLSDHITVADAATLRALPGTVVKSAQHKILTVNGTMTAVGEAGKPIAFTDWRDDSRGGDANGDVEEIQPAPGWWAGIYVPDGGTADLQYCTIAYAGYSYQYAGLHKSGSGALTLNHSTMDHSYGAGLYLVDTTGPFMSSGNVFSNNARGIQVAIGTSFMHDDTSAFTGNAVDVHLNGGTIAGEASWYMNPAYSLHLSHHITVAEGALLQVLPGTVVKAAQHTRF
jgi:hypothetical protein